MSAEVFGLTQQILMLISAYINTGVCGKLHLWETTHFWQNCDTDDFSIMNVCSMTSNHLTCALLT